MREWLFKMCIHTYILIHCIHEQWPKPAMIVVYWADTMIKGNLYQYHCKDHASLSRWASRISEDKQGLWALLYFSSVTPFWSDFVFLCDLKYVLFIVPFSVLPSYEMITPSGNDDGVKPVKPSNHLTSRKSLHPRPLGLRRGATTRAAAGARGAAPAGSDESGVRRWCWKR